MIIALSIIFILAIIAFAFMQQPKFGKLPNGERLEQIKKSPHYVNGKFKNLSDTPMLTEDANYFSMLWEFFFSERKRLKPVDEIPSTKTDLLNLSPDENLLVWFGHSSYFIQIDGKKFLIDPVLSGAASPVEFTTRAFKGTDRYTTDDIPEIDYLIITHDHWDHLDYETVLALKPKIKKIITGLGVGAHLEYWGYDTSIIFEKDWGNDITLDSGFTAHSTPARHFSGRALTRNKTLWTSFVVQTPSFQIYIGGDSGYDTFFAEIGKKFGEFDLVILENGQYDKSWKYIHMMPSEVLRAAQDLHAKRILPVHSGKFSISNHEWDAPLKTITKLNERMNLPLITPIIGQKVNLKDSTYNFPNWWEDMN